MFLLRQLLLWRWGRLQLLHLQLLLQLLLLLLLRKGIGRLLWLQLLLLLPLHLLLQLLLLLLLRKGILLRHLLVRLWAQC